MEQSDVPVHRRFETDDYAVPVIEYQIGPTKGTSDSEGEVSVTIAELLPDGITPADVGVADSYYPENWRIETEDDMVRAIYKTRLEPGASEYTILAIRTDDAKIRAQLAENGFRTSGERREATVTDDSAHNVCQASVALATPAETVEDGGRADAFEAVDTVESPSGDPVVETLDAAFDTVTEAIVRTRQENRALRRDYQSLSRRLSRLESDFVDMEECIKDDLMPELSKRERRVDGERDRVARVEHDHGQRLDALEQWSEKIRTAVGDEKK